MLPSERMMVLNTMSLDAMKVRNFKNEKNIAIAKMSNSLP